MSSLLTKFLATTTGGALVLVDNTVPEFADSLDLPEGVEMARIGPGSPVIEASYKAIAIAVPDRAALRRIAGLLPRAGSARTFGCYVAQTRSPVVLLPRPEWPVTHNLTAQMSPGGEAITTLRLQRATAALPVLSEFTRNAAWEHTRAAGQLVVGLADAPGDQLPVQDLGTIVGSTAHEVADVGREVPPDVILTGTPLGETTVPLPEHPVLGRSPVLVDVSDDVPPVDESVINPVGFERHVSGGMGTLTAVTDTTKFSVRFPADLGQGELVLDGRLGLSEHPVRALRRLRGVRLELPEKPDHGLTRIVAGLATAGVPLVSDPLPGWAADRLGPRLAEVLGGSATPDGEVSLECALAREEHSIRLRRAALETHSSLAWRGRLARMAGVPFTPYPSVSVVLATKREHMLDFALSQLRKQRGAEFEVVIATHGFTVDEGRVRDGLGELPVVVQQHPAESPFGDVLTAACHAASGDLLLKLDDDDWYGPDAITDLLYARQYSGAEVVGMPAEYVYVEPLDLTIRRNDDAEFYAKFIAGGTIMIDRELLRSVGWYRSVRKYVDLQLLTAVHAAGASVYRTHGLGYVMRRTAGGHTWDPGIDFFLNEKRILEQWPGFVPSALLEHGPDETPRPE